MYINKSIIRILSLIILIAVSSYSQTVTKVLISGTGGQHDIDVQTSFELGYKSYDGTEFSGIITQYFDVGVDNSFAYAEANGYQMIVRSTTGLAYAVSKAPEYSNIQLVMPAGSNSHIYVYSGDIENCPVIITGAGDDNNETGYKVEFYGPDPITVEPDYSSFSNGYVAGQLAFIANEKGLSVAEARQEARKTIPGDSNPDMYDGYGAIDVDEVLNGSLPVELVSFSAILSDEKVDLAWSTATEVNNYGFQIERSSSSRTANAQSEEWEDIGFVAGHGNSNSPKNYKFTDTDIPEGELRYRLKQIDTDGTYEYYNTVASVVNNITGLDRQIAELPTEFKLYQNFPNPFNPETTIKFSIPPGIETKVRTVLKVYSVLGQEIATLVDEYKSAGIYECKLDGRGLTSGIYFYTIQAGDYTQTKKLMLAK